MRLAILCEGLCASQDAGGNAGARKEERRQVGRRQAWTLERMGTTEGKKGKKVRKESREQKDEREKKRREEVVRLSP